MQHKEQVYVNNVTEELVILFPWLCAPDTNFLFYLKKPLQILTNFPWRLPKRKLCQLTWRFSKNFKGYECKLTQLLLSSCLISAASCRWLYHLLSPFQEHWIHANIMMKYNVYKINVGLKYTYCNDSIWHPAQDC